MQTISAKDARTNFSAMLDDARLQPVMIKKNGRAVAVVLSAEEYARLEAMEDAIWLKKARQAEKKGFVGTKAGEKWLKDMLRAEDQSK